jgi:hypothetical protein
MPAGSTYTPIATNTLGSATATVTFSSIPSTYTDLRLVVVAKNNTASYDNMAMQVGNGSVDTGANYSLTYVQGNGTTATSGRFTAQNYMLLTYSAVGLYTNPFMTTIDIQSYSNTSVYRSILARNNEPSQGLQAQVALWRNNSQAIDTIKFYITSGSSFATGSTFTLYGITAA